MPGVVAVGAGPERKGGKLTGEPAVVVTVRRKLARRALEAQGGELLPSRLGGVPVDVVELGAPVEAPEIVAAQQAAVAVLETVRDEWLAAPNVSAVGVGYKRTGGVTDFRQIALQVFVHEKLSRAEIKERGLTPVPAKVQGVVTDVEVLGALRPASSASGSRDDRKDPIVGGATVGVNTKPFWYGTLGAIVFDRDTGEQMVLSNQHVLDGPVGTEVVQPSPIGLDDSLEIGFQLDLCNPLHFFRLDTPNTTVGSVLAGAAAAAALAAALSDEIDPTRRGQDATVPPAGAKTLLESHEVRLGYPQLPIPGTHFKVRSDWRYTRHTDAGDQSTGADEVKVNPHVLADKLLLTDRTLYHPGDTIRLLALILPEACNPHPSEPAHTEPIRPGELRALREAAAATTPPLSVAAASHPGAGEPAPARTGRGDRDQALPVPPLPGDGDPHPHDRRPRLPGGAARAGAGDARRAAAAAAGDHRAPRRREAARARDPPGALRLPVLRRADRRRRARRPWRHYLFVQTVNTATTHMKPTEAAQIIGGLPVSQNTRPQLDVACGPVVYEDGQFDIELL